MFIEFGVGNYRSFKDIVTLSMVAANLRAKDKELDANNVFSLDKSTRLLKSAAVYGANASGKSNLVHAIHFMRQFVLDSSKDSQAQDPIDVESFRLDTETEHAPSYFQMIFFLDGKRYRYGFEADAQKVHAEWLYHVPTRNETRLFVREGNTFDISGAFKEGRKLSDKTRPNALFLSVVAQFNGPIALAILGWFRNLGMMSGLSDAVYRVFTIARMKDQVTRDKIVAFVKRLDTGIANVMIEDVDDIVSRDKSGLPKGLVQDLDQVFAKYDMKPAMKSVMTQHSKYDQESDQIVFENFDLDEHESDGTQKIFALAGPLLEALYTGRVLVIDELDARLHPLVTRTIIELFNSQTTNPRNAQLIFATHDANLLSNKFFRRDQIWFTEKDRYGATDLYSLAEFKKVRVRNDASFSKDYIAGKYGAIPFIGSIVDLVGDIDG